MGFFMILGASLGAQIGAKTIFFGLKKGAKNEPSPGWPRNRFFMIFGSSFGSQNWPPKCEFGVFASETVKSLKLLPVKHQSALDLSSKHVFFS